MWIKECKEGEIVVRTLKHITEPGCEGFCRIDADCKTYFYHDETANCALTSAVGGTSRTNGISGPDLPLKKPIQIERGRSKGPAEGTEDCSEFHFTDCVNENLPDGIVESGQDYRDTVWVPKTTVKVILYVSLLLF